MDLKPFIFYLLFLALQNICNVCSERILQTYTGGVGATNYTHYKIMAAGEIRLLLESIYGDADIYVSDQTLKPDFDNYQICSVTCGDDMVVVPETMKRPIGVSVYGHKTVNDAQYRLSLIVDTETTTTSSSHSSQHSKDIDDVQSVLWNIFVFLGKIIFDILL